ncbi:Lrp/AsnC family transcriptional regulator [Candidatus Woesearchaeota archaeon]|nr:Lrp/AsnC family transcriptional regulator [Candidatus Woesearchaeota archaeon]
MKQDIDLYDKKLLFELDKNSALPISKLARRLKRSKQFILYRIKKLEDNVILTGYTAIVDMSKLGYFTFRVYLRLQRMNKEDQNTLIEYVKKNLKQVWTITSMHGKWDIALFLGVKNITEFHTIWGSLLEKYKRNIKNYNVAVYAPIINYNRKIFLEKTEPGIERIYGAGTPEPTDKLDLDIIEAYAPNVRQSAAEIARKLKVSPDTIRQRIKRMEKRDIIAGYKIGLDLEKLGYVGYRVDLQLVSTHRNKELLEFCKTHRNIYQINRSIGGADFEIEVIVKDLTHLLEIIDEIETKFKDVVNDAEWFGFSTFHILKYIPD